MINSQRMNKNAIYFGIAIVVPITLFAFLSNSNNQPALIGYAFTLDQRGQLPGEFIGKATAFDIQRSLYRNVSVTFDKKTQAHIQSITGMVGMRITPSNDTLGVTINNLEPNTKYYKYVDHLDNLQEITTDEAGSVTFQQDASQERYIMIFTSPSTYFIEDNATGGDCEDIGAWNDATKTCTLNKDITKSIEIRDNGITLDGDNHTVQGPDSNIGIYINGGLLGDITDVTIKDITVRGFSKGIQINNTNNVNLINVITTNNADGTEFYRAENSSIIDSFITSNTSKGLIIGTSSDVNGVTNNTITSNGVGIDLGLNSQSSISRNNIKSNTTGITVSAIGGANTFLWQNNLDNTNQVSILFDGDTQFYKAPPIRGNFWADHACTQDTINNNICTNRYLVKDRSILSDIYDEYPCACEDGWIRDCPLTPPTTVTPTPTSGNWGEIINGNPTVTLFADQGKTTTLKRLPNGWVVKILEDSGTMWHVQDVTDDSVGWLAHNNLEKIADPNKGTRPQRNLDDAVKRKIEILKSIDHFYNNDDSKQELYSSDDLGRDGAKNNISSLKKTQFPVEIFIAMLVEEARGTSGTDANGKAAYTEYNNELRTYDFGYGLLQMTNPPTLKGSSTDYSTTNEKCEFYRYVQVEGGRKENYLCKFYTNTIQGIALNIKDGFSILVSKLAKSVIANANKASLIQWAGGVWRYNGNNPDHPGNYKKDYLSRIGLRLKEIEEEFGNQYRESLPISKSDNLLISDSEISVISNKFTNYITGEIKSPAELSTRNNKAQITGLYDGKIVINIPESDY